MASAAPNAAHHALAALEAAGVCRALITQNVDRLHAKARHGGALLELHGTLFEVECLACGGAAPRLDRSLLQATMEVENAAWLRVHGSSAQRRPDGDVELAGDSQAAYRAFCPPRCPRCGGDTLKPAVTFFGGSVPPAVAQRSQDLAGEADAVVVCGSTCSTFSAFRLVKALAARGAPVVAIKVGPGRVDSVASLNVQGDCGEVLTEWCSALGAPVAAVQGPLLSPAPVAPALLGKLGTGE